MGRRDRARHRAVTGRRVAAAGARTVSAVGVMALVVAVSPSASGAGPFGLAPAPATEKVSASGQALTGTGSSAPRTRAAPRAHRRAAVASGADALTAGRAGARADGPGDALLTELRRARAGTAPGAAAAAGPAADLAPLPAGSGAIPARVLVAYRAAADRTTKDDPRCAIPWWLLAGIGEVESGHAAGGRVDADGRTRGPIRGPVLDGSTPGTAVVADSDHGVLDGDPLHDRAVGPMQFMPGTWAAYGADADGDGVRNPDDVDDAALAAARYLCAGGGSLADQPGQVAALMRYNRSASYGLTVLRWGAVYRDGAEAVPGAAGPVPSETVPAPSAAAGLPAASGPAPTPDPAAPPTTPSPTTPPAVPPSPAPDPAASPSPSAPSPTGPTAPGASPAPGGTVGPTPPAPSPDPTADPTAPVCVLPRDPAAPSDPAGAPPRPTAAPTAAPTSAPSPSSSPSSAAPTGRPGAGPAPSPTDPPVTCPPPCTPAPTGTPTPSPTSAPAPTPAASRPSTAAPAPSTTAGVPAPTCPAPTSSGTSTGDAGRRAGPAHRA